MVDRVVDFVREPATLRAVRHISANDAIFDGHFPELHLWPGALTIEGLAQTCNLLFVLSNLLDGEQGADVSDALRNLELSHRLEPGRHRSTEEETAMLKARLADATGVALTAAVDIKLTHPVFAGQRLDYRATHLRDVAGMVQCEVEATVAGRTVARGTLTAASLP